MAETRSAFDDMPGAASALWEAVKSAFSGPSAGEQIVANQEAKNNLIRQKKYAEAARLGLIDDPITGAFAGSTIGKAGPGIIRAYHGSPHDFDKFSLSKIGTGEGAQAYGHGLYFAGDEAVAKTYRDHVIDKAWYDAVNKQLSDISKQLDKYEIAGQYGKYRDPIGYELKEKYDDLMWQKANKKGHMYEVGINAPENEFLDWDVPLSRQPTHMREAFINAMPSHPVLDAWKVNGTIDAVPVGGIYKDVVRQIPGNTPAQKRATFSEDLNLSGVPGIKYLDAGSRGVGDGTRNYVVFDDSLIDILRKYGLAGLTTAGAAAAASDLHPEEGSGMADGGSLSDIGFSTIAPGLTPAEREALVDPLTGMPRTRNLGEILTGNAAPEVPGYTRGSQLSKWFPGGTSVDAWRPSVTSALAQPISVDPTIIVPSTAQEILGDINGGEGRSGPAGSANTGQEANYFDKDTPSYNKGSNYGLVGGVVGGLTGLGTIAGLAANAYGSMKDREQAQADLAAQAAALGFDAPALPGSTFENTASNTLPGMIGNAIASVFGGHLANTTAQDYNAALTGTPVGGLIDATRGLSPAAYDQALQAQNVAIMSALGAPAGAVAGRGPSGWEGSAFVGTDYGTKGISPGDDMEAAFGKIGGTEGYGGSGPDGGGLGQGGQGEGQGQGGSGANRNGGLIGYASGGELPSGSYVVPADVVGAFGNGSTIAGARHLGMALGGRLVDGPGDGRSDDIPFRGPGGRQINLSNGEVVIPPAGVDAAGGADRLDSVVIQKRKKQRRAMSAFGRPAR